MKNKVLVIISIVLLLLGLTAYLIEQTEADLEPVVIPNTTSEASYSINNPKLLNAYQTKQQKLQVQGQGVIVKVLKDDTKGSQHQRLLLRVNDKQTVLVAHNIDLAPRIANPKAGGVVGFYGEYVWNDQGGVIHWTHRDPKNRHANGWLSYDGKRYE